MIADNSWAQHIQNPQTIKAILGDSIPNLSGAELISMSHIFWRSEITMEMLLDELPEQIPMKWKEKGVNAVLCELVFNDVKYRYIKSPLIISNNTLSAKMRLKYEEKLFKVSLVNDCNEVLVSFDSEYLRVNFHGRLK